MWCIIPIVVSFADDGEYVDKEVNHRDDKRGKQYQHIIHTVEPLIIDILNSG